jgi:phosphatidylglycerophosphate synthase
MTPSVTPSVSPKERSTTRPSPDLARMRKPIRTLFGALLFRRISMPLSARLARTGIHPTQVTLAGLASGLAGAALLGSGGRWLGVGGAGLVWVAKILDAADGEIARAKHLDSSGGYVLDGLTDRVRDTAVITGCGVGAVRAGFDPGLYWTLGAVCGFLYFFYLSGMSPSHWREARNDSDVDEKHVFRVTGDIRLGAGDTLAVAVMVTALAGHLEALVIAVAVGSPVAIAVKLRSLVRRRPWERW